MRIWLKRWRIKLKPCAPLVKVADGSYEPGSSPICLPTQSAEAVGGLAFDVPKDKGVRSSFLTDEDIGVKSRLSSQKGEMKL